MRVQVQVISAVLGDISQLGLKALFGERYGSGWVLLRSQAFCSVPSGESPLAHHGLTICLNGGRVALGGLQEHSNPEFLQTGDWLGEPGKALLCPLCVQA